MESLEARSHENAKRLFETGEIDYFEIGTVKGLLSIHHLRRSRPSRGPR